MPLNVGALQCISLYMNVTHRQDHRETNPSNQSELLHLYGLHVARSKNNGTLISDLTGQS